MNDIFANKTDIINSIDELNYKDVKVLSNFINDQGKILPRRVTGLNSKQQKKSNKINKTRKNCGVITICSW
jgi:small subunit ribosomal protein S18